MPFDLVNGKMILSVTNSDNGSVVHINKVGLNVMKDNSDGFSLKGDSYMGYFRFVDVQTPSEDSLDALVNTVKGWVNDIYDNRFWTGPLFIRPKE